MPDAYRGFAKTIERLFGVNIQFDRAQGLAPKLQFNGVYLGGRTLYINVNSKSPYSTIIGHEFLHFLATNKPALYRAFEKIALPLMTARAEKHAMARMAEYKAAGHAQMKSFALGQEEVYADTFGDLWGDAAFWKELAGRQGAKGVVARVMDQLRAFLGRILKAVNLWQAADQTAGFYDDSQAIRQAVLDTTQQAMAERGQWIAQARERVAQYMTGPDGGGPRGGGRPDADGAQDGLANTGETISIEAVPSPIGSADDITEAERIFLSSFPAGTRTYRHSTGTARAARDASVAARRQIDMDYGATRTASSSLGAFSGYETRGKITQGLDGNPQLFIQVFGKEQLEAGLDYAPALSLTVDENGEFSIYGPPSNSSLYKQFERRGWAEPARDADGEIIPTLDGGFWTKLSGSGRADTISLLGDAHARAIDWRRLSTWASTGSAQLAQLVRR